MNDKLQPEEPASRFRQPPMTSSELKDYMDRLSAIITTTPVRYWVPPKLHKYGQEKDQPEEQ